MMNVGENRARNGVTDCPESQNEEKFQSMELLDSSQYATERLRTLRGTRWLKNILDSSGFLRGKECFQDKERFQSRCCWAKPEHYGAKDRL
ncbi:hypothetical protein E3N88_45719 [Mikania micrantha]|uniref:Uncharacterized protein n=1 Tax=Mikania micrantha TaxID=192012 RepID=A0A5N6L8M9_9ASTR|nr:hypothetical protein E3N88_45719 [Mikania micrantha]